MYNLQGVIYALISSATFGLIPLFAIPAVQSGMSVNSVVFFRFLISATAMGLIMIIKRINFKLTRQELKWLLLLSVLYASTSLLLTSSYFYIPSGTATTIHFLYPVAVALIMTIFFKEKASVWLYCAIILAVLGVYLLSDSSHSEKIHTFGLVLVFSTIFTYALYLVLFNRSCLSKMNSIKATFWILAIGMIIFLINVFLTEGHPCDIPSIDTLIDLILLGLVSTLISDLTLILALKRIGATTSAILGCMEPLTAVCSGILFLGEHCTIIQSIGLIIILSAVTIVIITRQRA